MTDSIAALAALMDGVSPERDALFARFEAKWRDEPLVHDVLRNINASEYTTPELAVALTSTMRRIASPA